MRDQLKKLPDPMQRQVLARVAVGSLFLLLFFVIWACFHDMYLFLPCLLAAVVVIANGCLLFYNGVRGNYILLEGICRRMENVGLRKRTRAVYISLGQNTLRIPVRRRLRGLSTGDAVILYLSDKEPVYERDGIYMIYNYYTLEIRKAGCVNEIGTGKIYACLEEIRRLIDHNRNEDGTCRFDALRVRIALEFAKAEVEKSVGKYVA